MADIGLGLVRKKRSHFGDMALFLGPAIALLCLFFILPIFIDVAIAFSEMSQTLDFGNFSFKQFPKLFKSDPNSWLGFGLRYQFYKSLLITLIYVIVTLTVFNVGLGLLLALLTTAIPEKLGVFYRAVWLLPRMSPSVIYALLWQWVVTPTETGLLNQVMIGLGFSALNLKLDYPMLLIIIVNGMIGASMGMIIFTSAIKAIPQHLFHAARVDGAGPLAITRFIILPALRWPISYITLYQSLALLVSFEYIWLIMGPARPTMTLAMLAYTKTIAPDIGGGQYAYGAAISLILILIGIVAALGMWRLTRMKNLLKTPRIEVLT